MNPLHAVEPRPSLCPAMAGCRYSIWASELSPFSLKARAMCVYAGVPHRWLPAEGGLYENLTTLQRIRKLKAGKLSLNYPSTDNLDEFPLVPFLLGDDGSNVYDSSAMAEWLDSRHLPTERWLLPSEPHLRVAVRLIDEYFDEFGLYMAHHNRWVLSAVDNDAGKRVAREFLPAALAPARPIFAERFSARQVRRLPYLFSVAPEHADFTGLPSSHRPPAPVGFPPTHELLDQSFLRMLERMELVLSDQHYLLGDRFTLADASAYGQLAMNLQDPSACELIEVRAPLTHAWLRSIERGHHADADGRSAAAGRATAGAAGLEVSRRLGYLLDEIRRTFVPLMQQNEAAYERLRGQGIRTFNEAAFNRGQALYDGELCGHPFRCVAKTFQVKVWRRIKREWGRLDKADKGKLGEISSEID